MSSAKEKCHVEAVHVSVKLLQEYRTNTLTAESKLGVSEETAAANCSVLSLLQVTGLCLLQGLHSSGAHWLDMKALQMFS